MAEISPAEGIKVIIEAAAIASLSDWSIAIGSGLDITDRLITIKDTGGLPANPKWLLDFPAVQIIVRGQANEYSAIWAVAKTIKDICLGVTSQTISGDRYVSITIGSDIEFIERDDNQRPTFTLNLRLIIEPQTNANTNRASL
ncbi:MAG: hypothetical protein COA78_37070 [Blastopirellula sp.]|nr:MAG: hypothetical protein COA78_37070 [Blastopirellula sp.]